MKNNLLLILFFSYIFNFQNSFGQTTSSDLQLIAANINHNSVPHNHATFMNPQKIKNVFKYNPFTYLLGGLMYFYQNTVSAQLGGGHCPYEPSCSNFSKLSIQQFGLIKGIAMTADRLTRCSGMALNESAPEWYNPATEKINNSPLLYRFKK